MIKIAILEEMNMIKHLPNQVIAAAREVVEVLEECYGASRDIDRDLGGYVVVVENEKDIELLKDSHLVVYNDIPENVDRIETENQEVWIKLLFLQSSDYAVVVIAQENLIELDKING